MNAPDPTDLRLVSALADFGRASVADLAGRAGVSPEEAAARLTRLGGTGLRLVVGAECHQRSVRGWLASQQPRSAPQQGWYPHPDPQPPPQPQPAWGPRGWGAQAGVVEQAPLGWGEPQSASWAVREPFRSSGPGEPAQASIVGVRWRSRPDGPTAEWQV